jgi:hypothetical protein
VTGDGNANYGRISFVDLTETALLKGWKVEIWSWRGSLNNIYLKFQKEYGYTGFFKIINLDEYRDLLTYKVAAKTVKATLETVTAHPISTTDTKSKKLSPAKPIVKTTIDQKHPPPTKPPAAPPVVAPPVAAPPVVATPVAAPSVAAPPVVAEVEEEEDDSIYMCPLSNDIFRDPVITPDGILYERQSIVNHLQNYGNFCPWTHRPLRFKELVSTPPEFLTRLNNYRRRHHLN